MDFKIKRLKLLNALSKTTKAVSIRSPLPVLTGIKLKWNRYIRLPKNRFI